MSAADWTPDTPVAGQDGDPDFGTCRVCQYYDAATGALMYRIEKEATTPAAEAELICIHVSAAYSRRLLSYIQSQDGGELGANGCLLLVRGATLASDGDHTAPIRETRAGFPDLLMPTRYNPEGSPDWSGQVRPGDAITPREEGSDSTAELPF